MEQGILPLNFGTKIFQDMQCLQNVTALIVLLGYPIFRQIQWQNSYKKVPKPFFGHFYPRRIFPKKSYFARNNPTWAPKTMVYRNTWSGNTITIFVIKQICWK